VELPLAAFVGRHNIEARQPIAAWPDLEVARSSYLVALAHADLNFTSLDDETPLFGNVSEEALIERHVRSGVGEIVIKNRRPGCRAANPAEGLEHSRTRTLTVQVAKKALDSHPQLKGRLTLVISAALATYALAANRARDMLRSTRAMRLVHRAAAGVMAGVALATATR